MPKLNENYLQLKDSYLFSEIAHRTAAYSEKHPDKPVIRLGIGDVTRPLCECAIKALHESVDEMGQSATFKGYGPEQGYAKTRDAIAAYYKRNGVEVDADAIFISDGAKSDTGNITELFGHDNVILIPDMKLSFPIRNYQEASMLLKEPENAPLSSAPCPKPPASPEPAAATL